MKAPRNILFVVVCGAVFLLVAAVDCMLRSKYSSIPQTEARFAYMYAGNLDRYSFLQYNQASADQGRKALLEYLNFLERIRNEKIEYPPILLHADFGFTYLRLYRLESAASNSAAAESYLKSAQTEFSPPGSKKEISADFLKKLIETRESNERLYTNAGVISAKKRNDSREGPQ